jgi:hypothetical protein
LKTPHNFVSCFIPLYPPGITRQKFILKKKDEHMSLHSVKPLATNFGKTYSEGLLPYAIKLAVKSPSVSPLISSAFAPYPLFQWYQQSKEILLNMGIKC